MQSALPNYYYLFAAKLGFQVQAKILYSNNIFCVINSFFIFTLTFDLTKAFFQQTVLYRLKY